MDEDMPKQKNKKRKNKQKEKGTIMHEKRLQEGCVKMVGFFTYLNCYGIAFTHSNT